MRRQYAADSKDAMTAMTCAKSRSSASSGGMRASRSARNSFSIASNASSVLVTKDDEMNENESRHAMHQCASHVMWLGELSPPHCQQKSRGRGYPISTSEHRFQAARHVLRTGASTSGRRGLVMWERVGCTSAEPLADRNAGTTHHSAKAPSTDLQQPAAEQAASPLGARGTRRAQ